MPGSEVLAGTVFGMVAVALGGSASAAEGTDALLRVDLAALSRRTVLFGHQSVGMNLLDGVAELAKREGVPLSIVDVSASVSVLPGTVSHLFVLENGRPFAKLQSFSRALASLPASGPDIAFVKFCYVDFEPSTDSAALFMQYQKTIADLQAAHPGTRFVHVTAPLSTVQTGPKAWAKRLVGRSPYGLAENDRREVFNALMRDAYAGRAPIFDLARVESTLPDGTRSTATWKGRTFPVLAAPYTDDGGHLNEAGRIRAARELIAVLASVPLVNPATPAR